MSARPGLGLVAGRDPSGATWTILRADGLAPGPASRWRSQAVTLGAGVRWDASLGWLELAPLAAPPARPPPPEALTGPDGTIYKASPSRNTILRRRPWETTFSALPGFGGSGRAVGRVVRPYGLAWHPRGWLLVTDAGNHRVQAVDPADGSVILVYGATDTWGAPCDGTTGGAMRVPVDVAVCDGDVVVADMMGLVHRFEVFGRWIRSDVPAASLPRTGPCTPVALACSDRGIVLADASWPALLVLDREGSLVGEVPAAASVEPRFAGLRLGGGFTGTGTVEIGPIDSGLHDVAWHEVRLEAEIPLGTSITVSTSCDDDPAGTPAYTASAPIREGDVLFRDGEHGRPVLADPAAARDTDRGRYLWVKLELSSDGTATPVVRALRCRFPRPSALRSLPARWSRKDLADPAGAPFAERFLAAFVETLSGAEARYEDLPRRLRATTAPSPWLAWVGSWLGLAFDPSWPEARRRTLIREAIWLYQRRGTPAAISRYIEIYTGRTPVIIEGFRRRPPGGAALGSMVLGAAPDADDGAHRFEVYVSVDSASDAAAIGPVVADILASERPAHTAVSLHLVQPDARVGIHDTVGVDLVVAADVVPAAPLGSVRLDVTLPSTGVSSRLSDSPPVGGLRLT